MIEFSIIDHNEIIPSGNYYEREKVLELIAKKYGHKYTFLDYLTLPFISIMKWYGEYIRLENFKTRLGESSYAYIIENLEAKVVTDVKYVRVFDKIIDGSQYVIEQAESDTQVVYQLTIYSQSGADAECYSFNSLHEAKVYIANRI